MWTRNPLKQWSPNHPRVTRPVRPSRPVRKILSDMKPVREVKKVGDHCPKGFQKAVEAIISCFPNVFVASRLESVVYASWSRVQADLNCMKDLLNSRIQWKYLLNTCGTDFTIKSNAEMVQTLKALNGRNSMESEVTNDYKKGRWVYHYNVTNTVVKTGVTNSPPPIGSIAMFTGNAYFVVSKAFVEHVLRDREVQQLLEWERDTYSPDEHLWATLQRMPSVPGSVPANIKYDVSDMQALARAVKWSYLHYITLHVI
uniref:beta-1,3-galactosyl-O-glycosyl-glycoprotein beta-1,6-N-acetylglucosaminyltransferase 3-like n=1 Tax=Gasterosteus aculeatus aculeatus TaxID=481459 RepID=UPI001A994AF6|nr:beta-1,3-galactosyl-O-glycosyl-glycoprotein beta-1,6-N-acetylglucosaminyltransferase 3-like [Gasterosteus aculeatus aculeatus]